MTPKSFATDVLNVEPSVHNQMKLQNIQILPTFSHPVYSPPRNTQLPPLSLPIPFMQHRCYPPPNIVHRPTLHKTRIHSNRQQLPSAFGQSAYPEYRSGSLQLHLEQRHLSLQLQELCGNQIAMLHQQLQLQKQHTPWERVHQQQLQMYYRSEIASSQIHLYEKIRQLQILQYRRLLEPLNYEQRLFQNQGLLQRQILFQKFHFEQQLSELRKTVQENEETIERKNQERIQLLDFQRKLEEEIETLKTEQRNNRTYALTADGGRSSFT